MRLLLEASSTAARRCRRNQIDRGLNFTGEAVLLRIGHGACR